MKTLKRKGIAPLFNLLVAGATLVALGVVLAVGMTVTNDIATGYQTTFSISNESLALTNYTDVPFTYPNLGVSAVNRVGNSSITLSSGNYTFNSTHVMLKTFNEMGGRYNTTAGTYDVTYTGSIGNTTAYSAANNATQAMANISKWQPTFGTVIAAGAIIALLLGSFVAFAVRRGQEM